ncbi:glycosyltransferase family 4 protein [Niallia sp. MER 6]|uniref:glycosyltransferase family 4 protein n=1 Tax=Niallia sp. MER 6 TaxID=2939567 RepID=UPI00203E8981|nr:glycosyltransferase family 4 protein [Niallia sp. MER 6]MCM3029814.1 glycosyltransferase family 4 protein [Niallia sp. MER 6]
MKVLMIGSHLKVPGGITRVVKNYIEGGLPQKTKFEYFPTYYGSNHLINLFFYIVQYIKLFVFIVILKKEYDVAHIHMSYKGSYERKKHIINVLKLSKIPVILHMHGSQFEDFFNSSSERKKNEIINLINSVNVIIALGKQWEDYYKNLSNTKVISLDNAVFPKESNDEEKNYITCMGVLSKRKGTFDLIDAVNLIKDSISNDYKFLIAGNGEVEKAKRKIKNLGLEDLFIVPGWISDQKEIEEIYSKTILYILPSYNEGMPMSILEAMSYGIPIISTDVGSIPSVLGPDNGLLVKPGNTMDLSEAIKLLLSDTEKLNVMRKSNKTKIKKDYNIYNSIEKILQIYKDVKYEKK